MAEKFILFCMLIGTVWGLTESARANRKMDRWVGPKDPNFTGNSRTRRSMKELIVGDD